jgi:hypothetical protein
MAQTISVTISDQNATQLQHAAGVAMTLGRDATGAETKAFIIQSWKNLVQSFEAAEATERR